MSVGKYGESPPSVLLLKAVRSNNPSTAEDLVRLTIDFYRQHYQGADSRAARLELGFIQQNIEQIHPSDPRWKTILMQLASARQEFGGAAYRWEAKT